MMSGLKNLGLAVGLGMCVFAGTARAQQPAEFAIGGLGSFTGPGGVIGESMRRGAEVAVELRGSKVLGVPIRLQWEDDETKPQVAIQKATRFTSDKVQLLFAPYSSGSTSAVAKVAERTKTPLLVTMAASDELTRTGGNRYMFRTSNSVDMELRLMLQFVKESGLKRVFQINPDVSVSREVSQKFKAMLTENGVSVVGEEFPAYGSNDYSILINKITQSDADSVMTGLSGNDLITFLKQAGPSGLVQKKVTFGLIIMDESLGKAVGSASSLGVHSAMRYHFSIDNPANKAFIDAYRSKYKDLPDQYAGSAFDGMAWFLDVIDATQSWDKEKWVDAMSHSERPNSVNGAKKMRSCDHQAEQIGYYGKAIADASGTGIVMQVDYGFPPDRLFEKCQ